MASLSDKQLSKALEERVGKHKRVRVDIEVWCVPGCEGAMEADINKALGQCVFVSDWGISVLDDLGQVIIP
jgi:hypothetical protein